ncbi:hypothetical protein [Streptomyces sp. NPDC058572]|uniref:hypothetical protein n=1 Tax=Streptomyces sp. NPDC058572 TaxID=3346546 RepID=UPI00364852A1
MVRLLPHPDRPRHPDPRQGHHHRHDLALVTIDLATPAAVPVTRHAWRRSIETIFAEARTLLGVGQARNRSETAVRRTVPFGLYRCSITVVRYAVRPPSRRRRDHRARAPWCTMTDPSFADMLAKLRRVSSPPDFSPSPQAVHRARAQPGRRHTA